MAAGLTLLQENRENFTREFKRNIKLAVVEKDQRPRKDSVVVECGIDELFRKEVIGFYKLLEPFGPKNPQPIFKTSHAVVVDSRTVGSNGDHLSVIFRTKYSKIKGIGFNLGDQLEDVQKEPNRKISFTPTLNRFRGTTSWQLRLISI